jgi:hypothetical protein
LFVLRTGCPWNMLPKEYVSAATCHRRFQQWVRMGVFQKETMGQIIEDILLKIYDDMRGIG